MTQKLGMLRQLTLCFCILLVVTLGNVVFAETQRPKVSEPALKMMQKLTPLAGRWSMTTKVTHDGGESWQASPENIVNIVLDHKGMVLAERPEALSAGGFNMITFISYDQYRKVFRKAAIDDTWGVMDLYEGEIEGDKLVLTNLKSGTFFPVAKDVWRAFKLTLDLKGASRQMLVDASDDGGVTWKPAFIVEYTRIS